LFVSDFVADENSGAAGSLIAIGRALERAGHRVDFEWKDERPYRLRHATAARLLELGARQRRQIETRLGTASYDVVSVSQPFAFSVYERIAPRYPQILFLNRTHGWEARLYDAQRRFAWDGRRAPTLAGRLSAALTRRACRRTARAAQGIITPASRCATWIRTTYGLSRERVATIPYGLDAAFSGARAPVARERALRLLYVGNYLPLKGSGVLESILPDLGRRYPNASLTLVVDDGGRRRAIDCFRPIFGDRLSVHGWLDRSRLAALYASHDVFLFPSLFEGFGKAWLEAMAFGMCVVGFGEGGLPDVAQNGAQALFCPPADVDGLRTLLARVLEAPAQARAVGERAQGCARAFTWDRTARETIAFAERLIATR
jgi:glycosyltransferase involved in cell wall biosynthesis